MNLSFWFYVSGVFATAILKTPYLPVIRDKFVFADVLFLIALVIPGRAFILPRFFRNRIVKPWGVAFVTVCVVSAFFALISYEDWHLTGIVIETANYTYGVLLFALTVRTLDSWSKWNVAIFAWLGGMALVSLVGGLALFSGWPSWAFEETTHRLCSTMKNENQVPMLILPMMAVAISNVARKRNTVFQRTVWFGFCIACFLTAIGTGSRTALLMLICSAAGLGFILSQSLNFRREINLSLLTFLGSSFVAGIIVYFVMAWASFDGNYSLVRTPAWQRPAVRLIQWQQGEGGLDETRPKQIKQVIRRFPDHPLLGVGPKMGSFILQMNEVHNTYFSLLFETGILGLMTFLLMVGGTIHYAWSGLAVCRDQWYRHLGYCLLLGFGLILFYNGTMLGIRQRNIWILMGMLIAFGNLTRLGPYAYMPLRLPKRLIWFRKYL